VKVPVTVGVPEMVMLPPEKVPVTPAGRPENVAPVAHVVLYVIGVIAVFTQTVWLSVPGAEVSVIGGPTFVTKTSSPPPFVVWKAPGVTS